MRNFKVVYAKNVKFEYLYEKVKLMLTDQYNQEYTHIFSKRTKMYNMFIEAESKEDFTRLFVGAPFVFIKDGYSNWQLLDFRTNEKKVFVQSEDNLNRLADILGVEQKGDNGRFILGSNSFTYNFDANEDVRNSFEAKISMPFNPFSKEVSCDVGLERLVCLNGMRTNSSVFAYKIPVINKVEENLRIALGQIAPNIQNSLKKHIEKLQNETASLAESKRTNEFVIARDTPENALNKVRIQNLALASNVYINCKSYDTEILEDYQACKQYPSHLTRFDIWNILTELDSHTKEEPNSSSSLAVQRYINTIMFNSATFHLKNERTVTIEDNTGRFNASHLTAFWGK